MIEDYIGDGVYVRFDGFGLELRANSSECPTDTIYLEPEVLAKLLQLINRLNLVPQKGE